MIRYIVTSFGYAEEAGITSIPWVRQGPSYYETPHDALSNLFDGFQMLFERLHPPCLHSYPEGSRYCPQCGRRLEDDSMHSLGFQVATWVNSFIELREHQAQSIFEDDMLWTPCDTECLLSSEAGEVVLVYETEELIKYYVDKQGLRDFVKSVRGDWKTSFW